MNEELNINNDTSVGDSVQDSTTNDIGDVKTYTQEQFQSEVDRRVTQALNKQAKKYEKQLAENAKLAQMDNEQRQMYEYEKRVAELEKRELDFAKLENKLTISKILSERDLPNTFIDFLVSEDADMCLENINQFEQIWRAAINDEVNKRLSNGGVPQVGENNQLGMSKEKFNKLSISEKANLLKSNPKLYEQLNQ